MTVKIFIINLKKSTDRKRFIQKQLQKLDLDSEFIEASEPGEISDKELVKTNLYKPYDYELTKEDIACALSHIKARMALAQDESCTHGLILEDDVYLSRYLSQILTQLQKVHRPNDIILLCSLVFKPIKLRYESELCRGYGLVKPDHNKIHGAQAYFMSRGKAKELSNQLLPITTVADDWYTFLQQGCFSKLYLVYPFPVVHAEFISVRSKPNSSGLRTAIKNLIVKYEVFPFYHIFFGLRLRSAEHRRRNNIHALGFNSKKTYKL